MLLEECFNRGHVSFAQTTGGRSSIFWNLIGPPGAHYSGSYGWVVQHPGNCQLAQSQSSRFRDWTQFLNKLEVDADPRFLEIAIRGAMIGGRESRDPLPGNFASQQSLAEDAKYNNSDVLFKA